MRNDWWQPALVASLVLLAALPVAAKTRLEKISISGPGLDMPIEITDEQTLRLANPWFGTFIEWRAPAVEARHRTAIYDVVLHARLRSSELRPIYQFRYAPGVNGQRGLVYLPGKGEPWHRQNVSVIIRDNHDGRWNPASPEWDARIRAALPRSCGVEARPPRDEMQQTNHGQDGASPLNSVLGRHRSVRREVLRE